MAVVDLVSLPVIAFAIFRIPVLFYCHFPDKALESSLRAAPASRARLLYRKVIDRVEALALARSTRVACNSEYTRKVFRATYPSLPEPAIVYPCVRSERVSASSRPLASPEPRDTRRKWLGQDAPKREPRTYPVVSLNRYERKKNIALALHAAHRVVEQLGGERSLRQVHLTIAGGYDPRVPENVAYFKELQELSTELGLDDRVELKKNITDAERTRLLSDAVALVYTPANEHFGIVPLEAMAAGTPVVAVNSGGPVESILDGQTGFLCRPTPEAFADALTELIGNPALVEEMGNRGKLRVESTFSRKALGIEFEALLRHSYESVADRKNR